LIAFSDSTSRNSAFRGTRGNGKVLLALLNHKAKPIDYVLIPALLDKYVTKMGAPDAVEKAKNLWDHSSWSRKRCIGMLCTVSNNMSRTDSKVVRGF